MEVHEGFINREIAAQLGQSEPTVMNPVIAIPAKGGRSCRSRLIAQRPGKLLERTMLWFPFEQSIPFAA
ncbi:MAG: hypothetical protein EA425_07630 [Puniceicoccaceae bacterium]|nr:MAG: hypothetical protein EA425_07630 [Puniceicoccaceae bacterium]